MTELLMLE